MDASKDAIPAVRRTDSLFFDLDGTLAAIADDPRAVCLDGRTSEALVRLSVALEGAVAVISGRDLRDLSGLVPIGLWRAGSHGLEICAPFQTPSAQGAGPPGRLIASLRQRTRGMPGVRIESKMGVVALHYRAAPQLGSAVLEAAQAAALACDGYVVEHGKMIVELKPRGVTKGAAIQRLMAIAPFGGRRPWMFGDDTTDESAFEVAMSFGGEAVKIGPGATCANHRLDSSQDMRAWVEQEAARFA
jgi:trehalose 6-phosphate phosphatase